MNFIKNGPDLPERLLQAHEEGNVVFFCGAGISYSAGLPSFEGLVKKLYSNSNMTPNQVQEAALKRGQFDRAVSLLEESITGGREIVRPTLIDLLKPDLSRRNAKKTHDALLTLARNREDRIRLITTNFDHLFEMAIKDENLNIERYKAPLLPIPKSRWDGLVYLHGLLPESANSVKFNDLVISSGDFGLAYLTERWAARFVSELFRNYTVCFVGYSIDDPVLRYIMDALAADRSLGESLPEVYAFGSYSKGKKESIFNEWRAKNVTPILYQKFRRHYYLHKTLWEWAETYRDGIQGKEQIAVRVARTLPLASTKQDNFVGRLLWALSDSSGIPAQAFADCDPVPLLEWLEPINNDCFNYGDLIRFGVIPDSSNDKGLKFSLVRRPASYKLTPRMTLMPSISDATQWDKRMTHLARWLTRHLDNPKLLFWLARQGGKLHERFVGLIEEALSKIEAAEKRKNAKDIEYLGNIRSNAPDAIPGDPMRKLWRLLLINRAVAGRLINTDFYSWIAKFKREGLTAASRLALRKILEPVVDISEPFRMMEDNGEENVSRVKDVADCKIVFRSTDVHYHLVELKKESSWKQAQLELLPDFIFLLKEALLLMEEVEISDERQSLSFLDQPSITEHEQNRKNQDWTLLIELVRDAWLTALEQCPEIAIREAALWMEEPFPLFKRLSFFAAAQDGAFTPEQGLDWLLSDDAWWLWSAETQREVFRLIVSLVPKLNDEEEQRLESAILVGPPNNIFVEDIDSAKKEYRIDRDIWLRLAKISQVRNLVSDDGIQKWKELLDKYPEWKVAEDESDEFVVWMSSSDELQQFNATPSDCQDLVLWLKENPEYNPWHYDDWRQRCSDSFPEASCALCSLAQENTWPTSRWKEALQAWSEEPLLQHSWRYMAPTIDQAPLNIQQELSHSIAWWLDATSKSAEGNEEIFFSLISKILEFNYEENTKSTDLLIQAVNHPVGLVTQALLNRWYKSGIEDGAKISEPYRSMFTSLFNISNSTMRHGRVVLARNIVALFRVDSEWTMSNLTPLFDWENLIEAQAIWQGFLSSARIYEPLVETIKTYFLDTANHYADLGQCNDQYVSMLTLVALDSSSQFKTTELAEATQSLPTDGLPEAVRTLIRLLRGAGEQKTEYWENRILPYINRVWPKTNDIKSPEISRLFAELCINAGDSFPDALTKLKPWLDSIESSSYLMSLLHDSGLIENFSQDALTFLDIVIKDGEHYSPSQVKECLQKIQGQSPELANDPRFQRLKNHLRGQ